MSRALASSGRDWLRQAAPAFFLGGFIFVAVTLRHGSPALGVTIGSLATLFLGLPLWVWWDATRLGLSRPVLWGVFVLFTTVVGATVYFLLRPDASRQGPCRSCQRVVLDRFTACPWCGTPRESTTPACSRCHEEVEPDWLFCPYCRLDLSAPLGEGAAAEGSEAAPDDPLS